MIGPEYEFLIADFGMNVRNSDGGNWSQSLLKNGFGTNTLNLPNPMPLPGRKSPIPYVCTGVDAFPLSWYKMNRYPQRNLTLEKLIFNYRLSIMRRISEMPENSILGYTNTNDRCFMTQNLILLILKFYVYKSRGSGNFSFSALFNL